MGSWNTETIEFTRGGLMFKWLSRYRERSEKEQYTNGYGYAAGKLLRKEMTVEELTIYFDDLELDSFDRGVVDAIHKLKEIGFIKDDQEII